MVGSYCCWFVKKYCWLVCVREKYCSGWKFTIVYDKPQPNEQAAISIVAVLVNYSIPFVFCVSFQLKLALFFCSCNVVNDARGTAVDGEPPGGRRLLRPIRLATVVSSTTLPPRRATMQAWAPCWPWEFVTYLLIIC